MTCAKCGGDRYIHPSRPNGKIDYSRVVLCVCQGEKAGRPVGDSWIEEPYYGYYQEPRNGGRQPVPEDFDFPCSESFRNYFSELCGEPVQQASSLTEAPQPTELVQHTIVYEHSDISERNLRRLDNAEGQLTALKNILKQIQARRKQSDADQDYIPF